MQIDLTDEEFQQLVIMAGYAMGAATKSGEQSLARSFLRVANAMNKNNPRWTRYQVEDEPEPHDPNPPRLGTRV
jgi:hypothetical protein